MSYKAIYFYSKRYLEEKEAVEMANHINEILGIDDYHHKILESQKEMELNTSNIIAIILTGATQHKIMQVAKKVKRINIVFTYKIEGLVAEEKAKLLGANCSPAIMDSLGYLTKFKTNITKSISNEQVAKFIDNIDKVDSIKNTTILQIGKKENWVISVPEDVTAYEKLGIKIKFIEQEELLDLYNKGDVFKDSIFEYYNSLPKDGVGENDVYNASKMASCMEYLLQEHKAKGISIACFDLLKSGTSACVGASYINGETDCFVSCEGDLDSALTMLFVKTIAKDKKYFMANPVVVDEQTVNFSHCTAPIKLCPNATCKLMPHHESGIGVSPSVNIASGQEVSLCRVSMLHNKATAKLGLTKDGEKLCVCRTQVDIQVSNFLDNILGCHQLIVFGDIIEKFKSLCKMFNIETK